MISLALASVAPPIYFAYFMKGDGPRPAEQAKLTEMQTAHIGNLQALHGEGRLLAAGPCQDPSTERRGIMVLVGKPDSTYFTRDPFVQNKIMTVASWEWKVDTRKFETKLPDPNAITEFVLVEASNVSEADATRLHRYLIGTSTAVVGGPAEGGKAFFLVEGAKAAQVNEGLKSKGLPGTAYRQWMAKSAIRR